MIKGKNIVIVGIQSWDIPIGSSNCKTLQQNTKTTMLSMLMFL
jgi:hypothetical protein